MFTQVIRTIRDGELQDGHLDFHTAPELWGVKEAGRFEVLATKRQLSRFVWEAKLRASPRFPPSTQIEFSRTPHQAQ